MQAGSDINDLKIFKYFFSQLFNIKTLQLFKGHIHVSHTFLVLIIVIKLIDWLIVGKLQ